MSADIQPTIGEDRKGPSSNYRCDELTADGAAAAATAPWYAP